MSTIPQPIKKRWYKRWWIWTLLVCAALALLLSVVFMQSYEQSQRDSYAYLTEGTTVQKRDVIKTVSANGVIIPKEEIAIEAAFPQTVEDFLAAEPLSQETLDVDDILARLDQETIEDIVDTAQTTQMSFYASDSEVLQLNVGQTVEITIPSYDNGKKEFTGKVSAVSRTKEQGSAAASLTGGAVESGYKIVVSTKQLPKKVQNVVGLSVDMVVVIDEKKDVLALEPGAIQYDDNDDPFIYRVPTIDDDFIMRAQTVEDVTELLEKQSVVIGFQGDEYLEVVDGLKEGESVLVYIPNQGSDSPFGL